MIDVAIPNGGGAAIRCVGGGAPVLTATSIVEYFPSAKIGYGNYFYVYETNGQNWFGLSALTAENSSGVLTSDANIPVAQAYNMDKKIDDGLPTAGKIVVVYLNGSSSATAIANAQASDSATSCYNTTTNTYSTDINNGSGPNCALSFQMQGAAR